MAGISPSILILSGVQGDPRRYRAFHLYEQTRLLGLDSQVAHVTDRDLKQKLAGANIVILHRAAYNQQIAWLEREIHSSNGVLIQDLDDLIFDPAAFKYIHSVDFADPVRASLYQEEMALNRKSLEICDFVLTSTDYLAGLVQQLGKPVRVHRNGFSMELLALSEAAYAGRKRHLGRVVIGYASGTSTHNQDFALIKPALKAILSQHANAELWIVGPLDPGEDWGSLAERIRTIRLVPWRLLPEIQAQFDINLAPLEIDNPFGQSKSEIKYMEAGLLRIPTVASPSDAFKFALRQADNGFLAGDPLEWESTLEDLIHQPDLRHQVGEQAYQDVLQHYHPLVRAHELADSLKSMPGFPFKLPEMDTQSGPSANNLPSAYWSSADLERTPNLLQRGVYTMKYRSLWTLLRQIWIYFRRMVSPIFPYRNPI